MTLFLLASVHARNINLPCFQLYFCVNREANYSPFVNTFSNDARFLQLCPMLSVRRPEAHTPRGLGATLPRPAKLARDSSPERDYQEPRQYTLV